MEAHHKIRPCLWFKTEAEDAALAYLEDHRADVVLVLSDINMPGMTGLELLQRIKAEPPLVPVCMMTAYGSDAYRRQAEAGGCDGYLTQPIDFDALKARIRDLQTGG